MLHNQWQSRVVSLWYLAKNIEFDVRKISWMKTFQLEDHVQVSDQDFMPALLGTVSSFPFFGTHEVQVDDEQVCTTMKISNATTYYLWSYGRAVFIPGSSSVRQPLVFCSIQSCISFSVWNVLSTLSACSGFKSCKEYPGSRTFSNMICTFACW